MINSLLIKENLSPVYNNTHIVREGIKNSNFFFFCIVDGFCGLEKPFVPGLRYWVDL